MKPTKLIRDGKVAVLYSPGYGAGWSTWSYGEIAEFLTFDEGLVLLAEGKASHDEVKKYLKEKFPEAYICTLGWGDISVEWVPIGTGFLVEEYDGSEYITYESGIRYQRA